jgi:hypothetical protein
MAIFLIFCVSTDAECMWLPHSTRLYVPMFQASNFKRDLSTAKLRGRNGIYERTDNNVSIPAQGFGVGRFSCTVLSFTMRGPGMGLLPILGTVSYKYRPIRDSKFQN